MAQMRETVNFNQSERFAEGWYWALRSRELKPGRVKPLRLMGRELAIYRGQDGEVRALDAYCPHMGAHLAEGRVDGAGLRCFFHDWKFDGAGECVDIPALVEPVKACVRSWPVSERYGMIWLWTGPVARQPVPFPPELEHEQIDWSHGSHFVKECHPNVVMINAIDAHHFNTVHHLPVDLSFEVGQLNDNASTFTNTTRVPPSSALTRFIGRFYDGALTYAMSYWFGATGSVTLGPDFMHFYIVFALRMTEGGKTEGQTILLTKRRPGPHGALFNLAVLFATKLVGNYFARGDTRVFQTIRYDFKTPTKADRAIIDFVHGVDRQASVTWGDWAPVASSQELPSNAPEELPGELRRHALPKAESGLAAASCAAPLPAPPSPPPTMQPSAAADEPAAKSAEKPAAQAQA